MKCVRSNVNDFRYDASEVSISNLASCKRFSVGVNVLRISEWMTSGISLHKVREGPCFGLTNCNADGREAFFSSGC